MCVVLMLSGFVHKYILAFALRYLVFIGTIHVAVAIGKSSWKFCASKQTTFLINYIFSYFSSFSVHPKPLFADSQVFFTYEGC